MSSAIRTQGVKKEALTRFVKPESPTYDNGSNNILFPFTYSNQVLDITYAGNNFKSVMVDNTGNSPDSEPSTAISILGGPQLVTSLGANFKAYVRAWRSSTIDSGSPIEVVVPAQVFRVQEAARGNITSTEEVSWKISTYAPSGDNYIAGDENNKYRTTYVFKTPLTFSIVEGGVTKYITFTTKLDQE